MRFIKLTHSGSNEPLYVAAEHVALVSSGPAFFWTDKRSTWIYLVGGHQVAVSEPPDVVMAAMKADVWDKTVDALS